jgi:ParB family chromosome partitioning protein
MTKKIGSGISDLFGINEHGNGASDAKQDNAQMIDVEKIGMRSSQPRKSFDQSELVELSGSIEKHGMLQPVLVREVGDGKYELIAGERRMRAAAIAGLKSVPANVVQCSEPDVHVISLVENIQRAQLNPIDEAAAVKTVAEKLGCSHDGVARILSKSRSYVTNSLRMLSLSDYVKEKIADGSITMGHAKILAGRVDSDKLAQIVVEKNLSVKELSSLIHRNDKKMTLIGMDNDEQHKDQEDQDVEDISRRITKSIGLNTRIKRIKYGVVVTVFCKTRNDLELLATTLINSGKHGSSN